MKLGNVVGDIAGFALFVGVVGGGIYWAVWKVKQAVARR